MTHSGTTWWVRGGFVSGFARFSLFQFFRVDLAREYAAKDAYSLEELMKFFFMG